MALACAITLLFVLRAVELFSASSDLWVRPLAIALAVGILVGASCGLVIRDATRANLAAGVLAALVVSTSWAVGGVLLITAYFLTRELLRRRGRREITGADAVAGLRVFLLATVGVTAVTLLTAGIAIPTRGRGATVTTPPQPSAAPNIYFLLLDGYARGDTLRDRFGFDEQPLAAGLKSLGFDVYDRSTSNYNATELTLLSMLTGKYADEIPELWPAPQDSAGQARKVARSLLSPALLEVLRDHGYTIETIPPPVVHVRLYDADRIVQVPGMTDLEVYTYFTSNAGRIVAWAFPDLVLDDQRRRVTASLEALDVRPSTPIRKFLLAHLMVPHPPFLWTADGRTRLPPECFPGCNLWEGDTYRIAQDIPSFSTEYADQVRFINGLVLSAVSNAVANDPDAIFVVFGDHGSRLDKTDRKESFLNFFAARTPGHPRLFGQAPSLINTLLAIERAYLGAETPDRAIRHLFVPDLRRLLDVAEVPEP
jgi:hypothetical protein